MSTPHIAANKEDFAKIVLMAGDPLRAKWIAETFLVDAKIVTQVRGMYGYTGFTKTGKRVSVMGSGMGMPSIGIYSYELFSAYDVDAIVRIGTCGSYQRNVHVGDVVIAQGACTDSNWMHEYELGGTYSAIGSFDLLMAAYDGAKELGKQVHVGNILSADIFYNKHPDIWKKWAELNVLAVEMESYALYANAAYLGKRALGIFTVSDSFHQEPMLTPEQRQSGLTNMVEVALQIVEKLF